MFDSKARRLTAPAMASFGSFLARRGVSANSLTALAWIVGAASCAAVVAELWIVALVLWLLNRMLDGIDGAVAREQGTTELGGFLDIVSDFSIYSGFVLAVAIAVPDARLACVVLLVTYYVSGTAFLSLSSLLERRRSTFGDERSLRFVGGLAEGTETIVAYALMCLWSNQIVAIIWVFAAMVAFTALQRINDGWRMLRDVPSTSRA